MTYNDFIALHPWVDLTLNLFETFAPVIVAILAIIINNSKSSKRDKLNKKLDMIVNCENILIQKVSLMECAMGELIDKFGDVLQCTTIEKVRPLLNDYKSAKSEALKSLMELYNYSTSATGILYENIDAEDIGSEIRTIIKSIDEMIVTHVTRNGLRRMGDEEIKKANTIKDDYDSFKAWQAVKIQTIMEKTFELVK